MINKYDEYLDCNGCKKLSMTGYGQVITNIVEDDEIYITELMKKDFFEYLKNYDDVCDIISYCDDFFDQPKGVNLSEKKYILKGRQLPNSIYEIELGRVVPKKSFRKSLNNAIFKQSMVSSGSVGMVSDMDDELLLESLLIDSDKRYTITDNIFKEFLIDSEIGDFEIQEHPMWTFEGLSNDDVYLGINLKDLPCLLGLPGPKRTEQEYNAIPRITFSFKIPNTISVHKPTSFDAGVMTVWRCGGKSKNHIECEEKYANLGFEEYVHEPINFKNINSNIFRI